MIGAQQVIYTRPCSRSPDRYRTPEAKRQPSGINNHGPRTDKDTEKQHIHFNKAQ